MDWVVELHRLVRHGLPVVLTYLTAGGFDSDRLDTASSETLVVLAIYAVAVLWSRARDRVEE